MKRHKIFRSGRISETEKMIAGIASASVLEIGAGDHSFDHLKREGSSWIKVDFAPPCDVSVDLNNERLRLPFDDASFDLAICTEVIEHLLWPQSLLSEVRRILSDDGRLLLSVPNIVSLTYRIAWMIGHIPSCAASGNLPPSMGSTAYETDEGTYRGGHVVNLNKKKLEALLGLTGFTPEVFRGSGIILHRQVLPPWMVPVSFSSNIICLARKSAKTGQ